PPSLLRVLGRPERGQGISEAGSPAHVRMSLSGLDVPGVVARRIEVPAEVRRLVTPPALRHHGDSARVVTAGHANHGAERRGNGSPAARLLSTIGLQVTANTHQ